MIEIGTRTQAQNITPGHIVADVWGNRTTVFTAEVTAGGALAIFNREERMVTMGAEEPLLILGHFNLGD